MRKSSTCAKASTAHVRRSRRSRSGFPRRAAPASRCRGRNRPARRLPARKAQAASAPAPASPPRVNAPPPSVPAPSAPVLPRAPCAGRGAGRLPSVRCRHKASARHPSEALHRGQRPGRRQRVRRVRVGVLRRQRRLRGRGSGLSSDGTNLSAIAPWLAGIYPLPCDSRGGLGWGRLSFSVQPNVAMASDNQEAIWQRGALAARCARTPPQPSPTVAGEGAHHYKRRDTRLS